MKEKRVNDFIRDHLLKDVLIKEYWSKRFLNNEWQCEMEV